jgi:hypothetical protein
MPDTAYGIAENEVEELKSQLAKLTAERDAIWQTFNDLRPFLENHLGLGYPEIDKRIRAALTLLGQGTHLELAAPQTISSDS